MEDNEREQSLIKARLGRKWVGGLTDLIEDEFVAEQVLCLLAEFQRLDAKEQKQIKAGKKFGKLGAPHGKKGGRPRKETVND